MSVIKRFRAGTQIFFRVEVRDESQDTRPLVDPDGGVRITLRNPHGAVIVDDVAMTETATTGVFTHLYQSATTDVPGVWRVEYKATHGGAPSYSLPSDAFELVPA